MVLVGFFVVVLSICYKWQIIDATTVDSTPGLDFVPRPDPSDANNTLIYYKVHDDASVRKWTSKIDEFVQEYSLKAPGAENRMACSWSDASAGNKSCDVPLADFYPCNPDNQYNYHRAAPCVFLKLDKLLNWTPNPYNTSEDLPTDMPADLKQYITIVTGKEYANAVWVSCEGENPVDVEFLGPIMYIPRRGFPAYYFPYTNQEGYLSPLVAVLFENPKKGLIINIVCKAWAKNIARDALERRGSVSFQLKIDY
ncbi:sodium/potassium-transporting ATPase subunit beta-2-like [Maniola jurtina]|uniref:sodium/potassium-transporting ATPase subunit beta-2-like n=1 Tax=Maniola jurtina TaxID=191418 RepID=UPI001E68B3AD|nr:sodium/potassium-transporting ATPase subunit beta-2-like [Maniola jurtina]XP_045761576.1 sodium/potassium-transporting ATPase subunit beta-2-like [Maniola jurtina]